KYRRRKCSVAVPEKDSDRLARLADTESVGSVDCEIGLSVSVKIRCDRCLKRFRSEVGADEYRSRFRERSVDVAFAYDDAIILRGDDVAIAIRGEISRRRQDAAFKSPRSREEECGADAHKRRQ